jgi:hypothetical protein
MRVLKPGTRLKSAVCETQVIVIRGLPEPLLVQCGGAEMLAADEPAPEGGALSADHAAGSLTGKRYVDAEERIELLCTKAGQGSLAIDGTALAIKMAKALPSSD